MRNNFVFAHAWFGVRVGRLKKYDSRACVIKNHSKFRNIYSLKFTDALKLTCTIR